MKQHKLWSTLAVLATIMGVVGVTKPASAANDYSNSNPQMGVMLSKIDDDTDPNNSTWELLTKPGKVLNASVSIQNTSDSASQFNVSFEQARTNSQMNVVYAGGGTKQVVGSGYGFEQNRNGTR